MPGTVLCVILNFRTPEMTLRATRAALVAMHGTEGAITVVDNDSGDGSFERLRDATANEPRVRVIASKRNGGYGAGNNVGIRAGLPDGARPDYVYLLNSDAFPESDAIWRLRDYLWANPRCGFVGSMIRGEDDLPHVTAFRFPSIRSEFEGAAHTGIVTRLLSDHVVPLGVPEHARRIDWCAGASVLLRQEMLDEIGLFDEGFFLYFEETELFHRAADAGWLGVYLPDSRVVHVGSASTGMKEWARMPGYWFESRARYFARSGGRGYLVVATLAHLAGGGLWQIRRVVERKQDRALPYFLRDLVSHTLRYLRADGQKNVVTRRAGRVVR